VRKQFFLLFLVNLFFLSVFMVAHAELPLHIEVFPGIVRQGTVCLIRASGSASLQSIYVMFRGERFSMDPGLQHGTYEGLIGIDMSTPPAPYEIKVVGTDGDGKVFYRSLLLKVEKVDFGIEKLSLPSYMVDLDAETLERVNREAKQVKAVFQAFRNERIWRGAFIRPVEGQLSSAFGVIRIINGKRRGMHTGIDLGAEEGTPVKSCNSGVVVLVDELFLSGKSIVLDHGRGLYSMYFHFSESLVMEGDSLSTGAILGRVGSTGRSTKPHLHWGIRMNGARVDPLSLIKIETYH